MRVACVLTVGASVWLICLLLRGGFTGLHFQWNSTRPGVYSSQRAMRMLFGTLNTWNFAGVCVSHGRPYHPQTQGKDERFNRTIKTEVLANRSFTDVDHVQRHFDPWRDIYNTQRPHEALNMATPSTRYRPSTREFPEQLPPIEYAPDDIVRKVGADGYFSYKAVTYKISQAFTAQPIALRQTSQDGELDVFYCQAKVATIDLKQQTRI
jgi:hypothetical protein